MTRVLVADDEPDIRLLARVVLEHIGCDVVEAAHGQEAIEVLQESDDVDLVLLDIRMPVLSGWAVLETMERWDPPQPPVLIISAHSDPDAPRKTAHHGAAGYLAKPFTTQQLRDRVSELVPGTGA